MKFSTILIIVGIAIAIIGIGIVLMDNAKMDDVHANNAQANNDQAGEPKDKPRLGNLDAIAKTAGDAGINNPQPQAINPIILLLVGIVIAMAGLYDSRRVPSMGNMKRPGTI